MARPHRVDVFVEPVLLVEHVQDCGQGFAHHPLLVCAAIGAKELLGVWALRKKALVEMIGELGLVLGDLDEVLPEQIRIDFQLQGVHALTLQ
jgi:hypothetical protein